MKGEVSLIIQCVVTGRLLFRVSSHKNESTDLLAEHYFPSFKVNNPFRVSAKQGINLIRNATNADGKLFHSFARNRPTMKENIIVSDYAPRL